MNKDERKWGVWNREGFSLIGVDAADEVFLTLREAFAYVAERVESGETEHEVALARPVRDRHDRSYIMWIPAGDPIRIDSSQACIPDAVT